MLYRILTEESEHNFRVVRKLMCDNFDGFTMYTGQGFWKGEFEIALIIEVVTDSEVDVLHVAATIREQCKQECVMVQKIACEAFLI